MPETALDIARNAADIIGVGRPASLSGADPTERAMRALLNQGGRILSDMRNTWNAGWTILTREHVFETQAGTDEYGLPSDYADWVDGTLWDRSTYREMRGNLSPQEWQWSKSGLIETIAIAPYYRLRRSTTGRARSLWLDPTPSTADTLVLEYVSNAWVRSSDGSEFRRAIEQDDDEFMLPSDIHELDLIWRYKQSRGMPFAADLAQFEQERDSALARDAGLRDLQVADGPAQVLFGGQVPDTGFGT